MGKHLHALGVLAMALLAVPTAGHALTIRLNDVGGVTPGSLAEQGFQAAANWWEGLLKDNVTVNIDVGFSDLGAGILGDAASSDNFFSYGAVRTAMTADGTSADDAAAVAHLPGGATDFGMLINYTDNNPNGSGSAVAYLDNNNNANNTTIDMSGANAKALGLLAADNPATDASIRFNTRFSWDFNFTRSGSIAAGAFDFVGIAAHEIGHALGFISGVDILDENSSGTYYPDSDLTYVSPLDLFRYSATSLIDHVIDWSAGTENKYFSLDGGVSSIAAFSTGLVHGDGRQASHWKDNLGLGIMDPTVAPGEMLGIRVNDIRAMDVIGWDLPEPGSLALLLAGGLGLAGRRRLGRFI